MVGTAEDVEVSALFEDGGGPGARRQRWPRITVSVRGLADARPLQEIEFLDSARTAVPAYGRTGARLWVNGYQSWSACRVAALGEAGDVTGHWQLATLGEGGTGAQGHRGTG
ncbi:MAG: hypothetical protein AAB409_05890, partial [Gemmatimonadota bacterium]